MKQRRSEAVRREGLAAFAVGGASGDRGADRGEMSELSARPSRVDETLFGEDHTVQPAETPIWREAFVLSDWIALRMSPVYYGVGIPRGDGQPVLVVPGLLGTDLLLSELYWWLARIGYRPYYSQLGFNIDCPDASAKQLAENVGAVAEETGQLVRLVGHSLGGLLARSAALDRPESVHTVIALSAPFNDIVRVHPVLIAAMDASRQQGGAPLTPNVRPTCFSGHCTCRFTQNLLAPSDFAANRYSIYSKSDGLVAWESCVEEDPALNFEVGSSHLGITVNPKTYETIADLLARD